MFGLPGCLYWSVVRERLWSVIARRATAAVYRRSRRAQAARTKTTWLIDTHGLLPEPRLEEQLAVHLADRLPGFLIRLLGTRGCRMLAWFLAVPLRLVGRLMGLGPIRR
ncbi:hypothetical protein MNBD_PLANCTO03-1990, partial [hydrothermal vent metagenome]